MIEEIAQGVCRSIEIKHVLGIRHAVLNSIRAKLAKGDEIVSGIIDTETPAPFNYARLGPHPLPVADTSAQRDGKARIADGQSDGRVHVEDGQAEMWVPPSTASSIRKWVGGGGAKVTVAQDEKYVLFRREIWVRAQLP